MKRNRRGLIATWVAAALVLPIGAATSGVAAADPYTPDMATVDITLPAGQTPGDITKETPLSATIEVDSPVDELDYAATAGGEVKGRGNSTWRRDKKPYQIKLKSSAALLGMPSAKTWVLLANHNDATLMRNKLAFELARDIGMPYVSESRWVDLRINGEYFGNYLLTEKVEVKTNRVELANPRGVLVELDNNYGRDEPYFFVTAASGTVFTLKDAFGGAPDAGEMDAPEFAQTKLGWESMKTTLNKLDSLLANPNPNWVEISKIIDVDSFVKFFLVQELTTNPDAANSSVYMYKDGTTDKLHAGPVWDFDLTFGNFSKGEHNGADPVSELVKNLDVYRSNASSWWDDLVRNPQFVTRANEIWTSEVAYPASTLTSEIDAYEAELKASADNNFTRWPILGEPSLLGGSGGTYADTYTEEVGDLKSWVNLRQEHMRKAYGNVPVLRYSSHVQTSGTLRKVDSGQISGTLGLSRRLESFSLAKWPTAGGIQAKSHVQTIGWSKSWGSTSLVGTSGRSLRLEAYQLRLTGELATQYDISYRAHVQSIGWQPWVTNGATAGTTGLGKRIEAIQVRLLAKTAPVPPVPPGPTP